MQSVYEKTLALLYRGSRNAANNNAAIQVQQIVVCVFRQYFIPDVSSSNNCGQSFGSELVSIRIRIQKLRWLMRIRIQIKGFVNQKLEKKFTAEN
jgi:hypothetical protein